MIGTKFHQVYSERGRETETDGEVVAYEQNKSLKIEMTGKRFYLIVDYRFEPLEGGQTKFTQLTEVQFKSMFRPLIELLFKLTAKKRLATDFAVLKGLLEAESK